MKDYKIISIGFKESHKELYKWVRQHCKNNDYSLSYLIRKLLRDFKKAEELKQNEE